MPVIFPSLCGIDVKEADNPIQQIVELKHPVEGDLVTFTSGRVSGYLFRPGELDEVLILPNAKQVRDGYQRILIATPDPNEQSNDLSKGKWRKHPLLPAENAEIDYAATISEVRRFLEWSVFLCRRRPGSQRHWPQATADRRCSCRHMHWTVSESAATIVMPTGTGKTETMLSILVSMNCEKLLVIVPTDALRSQLAEKFLTLGVLKLPDSAVLKPGAKTPIVCTLQHIPSTPDEVDRIFTRAQVIVTTSHIAGQCDSAVQAADGLSLSLSLHRRSASRGGPNLERVQGAVPRQEGPAIYRHAVSRRRQAARWRHYFQISPQASAGAGLLCPDPVRARRRIQHETRGSSHRGKGHRTACAETRTKATSSWPAWRIRKPRQGGV